MPPQNNSENNRGGGTQDPAAVARAVTEAVVNPYLEEQARRLAEKQAALNEQPEQSGTAVSSKKLTGPGFWGIVCLALLKDISDVFLNLTLVVALFVIVSGLVINFIIFFYLFYTGVKPSMRKLATIAFSLIIGMVPFLSILPETTASLFILRIIENNERIRKAAEKKFSFSR